mgnify:CR=1 FL=1
MREEVDLVISSDPEDLERLAGMANMTGVPIQVAALDRTSDSIRDRLSASSDMVASGE